MDMALIGREQAADHRLRHRDQRIMQARARILWMQKQFDAVMARIEDAITGNDAVTHQEPVEIGAHGDRSRLKRLRFLIAAGKRQDIGVAHQLLVKK